jgi:hypothetical protein
MAHQTEALEQENAELKRKIAEAQRSYLVLLETNKTLGGTP